MSLITSLRAVFLAGAFIASPLIAPSAVAETLTVMQSEGPRSMDPGDQSATYTNAILAPIYEGLVARQRDLSLAPALATEWTPDDSGLQWTFKLRSGVTFHDGTAFDADAVVYNFNRHLDESRGLAASGRLRTFLEKVEKIDDETVRFTLKEPYPAFLDIMAGNTGKIVSPTADKAGEIGSGAVGTGPYSLAEYRSGDFVLETKYPDYWGEQSDSVDEIRWTWSSEPSVLSMAVQTGDADVINPVPPAFARVIEANPQLQLHVSDGSAVFWVALNTLSEELSDARVRQALNFATDRDGIVNAIAQGYATPANSPLPTTFESYRADLDPYPLDLDRARQLLDEAGYGDGFTMSVAVQEQEARIAEVLQAMWSQIGVTLDVRRMESGVWSAAAFGDPEQKAAQNVDAVIASWSASAPDLQFRPLYGTANFSPAGANLGFYSSETFDRLLDEAADTVDPQARNAIYGQLQEIVNEDAPHVLLYYAQDLFATRAGVDNVWVEPGGLVRVEEATKEE